MLQYKCEPFLYFVDVTYVHRSHYRSCCEKFTCYIDWMLVLLNYFWHGLVLITIHMRYFVVSLLTEYIGFHLPVLV